MKVLQIISCAYFVFCFSPLFAQGEFIIQLAAYEVMVGKDHFDKLSDEDIRYYKDHRNFYHYYNGKKYSSEAEAQADLSAVKAAYPGAIVLDFAELKKCDYCCNVDGTMSYEETVSRKSIVAAPVSFRHAPPLPVYTPPANHCMMPEFKPRNQQDFEKIRRVALHYRNAIVYTLPCAPKELQCYLSLRSSGFCGMHVYSRAEVSKAINCPDVNSCVYIVDASSKEVLDIEYEFKKIASQY